MTRTDITELLIKISCAYPNFKLANKEMAVELWFDMLGEYDVRLINMALKSLISKGGAFAPSIGEIIAEARKISDMAKGREEMSEGEAWALVRKVTSGNMEFERLPEEIQKAIGSKRQAIEWGYAEDVNWEVVQSQFLRSLRTIRQRNKENELLPKSIKEAIAIATQSRIAIESKEKS